MTTEQSIEDVIADPTRRYQSPSQVLDDPGLDLDDKRRILESWKKDAELLSTATNENMAGGEPPLPVLQEVNLALDKLEKLGSGPVN
jgi:hypothetical protein